MTEAGEPVGELAVLSAELHAVEVGGDVVVRAIDEFPIFAVLATQAEGTTVVRDAAELRVKESDRIATVAAELRKMGAKIEERPDGMVVHGPVKLRGRGGRLPSRPPAGHGAGRGRAGGRWADGRARGGGHRRLVPRIRRGDASARRGHQVAGVNGLSSLTTAAHGLTGRTRLVGVIGWPVSHSRSPRMHNAAFAALGLDWAYVPLPVAPERVEAAVAGYAALGFHGANVTVPHKQAVMPAP